MFIISNTVRDQENDCLDVKVYESFSHDEDKLISHTRVYRDDIGRMTQQVLFRRRAVYGLN